MNFSKTFALLLAACFTFYNSHAQTYSALWGKAGEHWNRERIPDFTTAGYKSGKAAIPILAKGVSVTAFGAKGDGITDNTAAFRRALLACKPHTALLIPAGTYLLTDSLRISRSHIVLRGEGRGKTTLYFGKGLEELYPDYNVHNKNQTGWSWSGALLLFDGDITGNGIEDLSIRFPDSLYEGHNFHERAYNAVGFSGKAHDGWLQRVEFIGADMGLWIEKSAHHITAQDWSIEPGPRRAAQNISGHHAVNIYGGHNLLQYFTINARYVHDLSVESDASVYNVFHSGRGKDLCIDHHNHAQSNNLFTDLHMGKGTRPYTSGGNTTPRGLSFHETYWHIDADTAMDYCDKYNTPAKHSANNVQVGIKTNRASVPGDADNNWFETIAPAALVPANLYLAQLQFLHLAHYR
ncbi:MAG TPA: glycosyl hydrolase family 28-related protein [Chitinophagaceae bacterium]|nr:glycosyl hydrolase family 28-related protein [Chitinophagaceae bacterium]